MKKIMFKNDYSEGAHPKILDLLQKTNYVQQEGYGLDNYSFKAANLIKKLIKRPLADIHFVTGGTQANLVVAAAILKPHYAIIAPYTAHINVHEAGAIEGTGHKIFQVPSEDGKIRPEQIEEAVLFHTDEHMVKPKMVFISQATELGTVYTKKELEQIADVCRKYGLYLYLDGARLAQALAVEEANLTLEDVAQLTDIFYIGGTKNGALLGEAIVITNNALKEDFRYIMKRYGALLAKGRIIALQFLALFESNLYIELGKKANIQAQKMANALRQKGVKFLVDSPTNQIFPILPNDIIQKLYEKFDFYIWTKIDSQNSAIRLVTSWATSDRDVEVFIKEIENIF